MSSTNEPSKVNGQVRLTSPSLPLSSHHSSSFPQIKSAVGTAEELLGNVIESAYQAVGGSSEPSQFTTAGKEVRRFPLPSTRHYADPAFDDGSYTPRVKPRSRPLKRRATSRVPPTESRERRIPSLVPLRVTGFNRRAAIYRSVLSALSA